MAIRVECDLPAAGESMDFDQLREFVEAVVASSRHGDDLALDVVAAPQDDSITTGLRVELERLGARPPSPEVPLGRPTFTQLVDVLQKVSDNEGDARSQLGEIGELLQELTELQLQ